MKFLKALINSLISGLFFSLLLTLLISYLNTNLDFDIIFLGQSTLSLSISYGLLVAIICLLVFFFLQFIFGSVKIALISPSFLMVSFSFLLLLFLVIFRVNYKYFLTIFNPEMRAMLKGQMIIIFVVAVLGLVSFYLYRYRKKVLFSLVYSVILGGALLSLTLQRLNYSPTPPSSRVANFEAKKIDRKITIIGLEGLTFDFIIPLISEEKLPNFSWFVEEGSWGKLESFSPNEPVVLNSSFNTGKYPFKHRQVSLYSYRLPPCKKKISVVPRSIFFRQLIRFGLLQIFPNKQPPSPKVNDIWKILEDNKIGYFNRDWPYMRENVETSQEAEKLFIQFFEDLKYETSDIVALAREAFLRDFEWENKAFQQKNQDKPQFFYLLLNGLNTVETYFYKYSFPDLFGNIEQEEINKYGNVIKKYYDFYDQIIGRYLASLKEDELLIVYSPHGIEPLPLWKRYIEWILGNSDVSAYHEDAPEGVIFFYGKGIVRGKNIEGMKIVDVAPTLLYYMGLPLGRDMDGVLMSSIFRDEFTSENPIVYISSYEEIFIKTPF